VVAAGALVVGAAVAFGFAATFALALAANALVAGAKNVTASPSDTRPASLFLYIMQNPPGVGIRGLQGTKSSLERNCDPGHLRTSTVVMF
jgi:hypothetical protein